MVIPLDLFSMLKTKHYFLAESGNASFGYNIKVNWLIFQIYVTGILLKFKDIKMVNCILSLYSNSVLYSNTKLHVLAFRYYDETPVCGSLNENFPQRLRCLKLWSPFGAAVRVGLGGLALLEEVLLGMGLEVSKVTYHVQFTFFA